MCAGAGGMSGKSNRHGQLKMGRMGLRTTAFQSPTVS